jgi:hypothetical protein
MIGMVGEIDAQVHYPVRAPGAIAGLIAVYSIFNLSVRRCRADQRPRASHHCVTAYAGLTLSSLMRLSRSTKREARAGSV